MDYLNINITSNEEAVEATKKYTNFMLPHTCRKDTEIQRMRNVIAITYLRSSPYKQAVEDTLKKAKLYDSLEYVRQALMVDMFSDMVRYDYMSEVEKEGTDLLRKWEQDNIDKPYADSSDYYDEMEQVMAGFVLLNYSRYPLDPIPEYANRDVLGDKTMHMVV